MGQVVFSLRASSVWSQESRHESCQVLEQGMWVMENSNATIGSLQIEQSRPRTPGPVHVRQSASPVLEIVDIVI